jgi:hypothetical protein
VTERKLTIDRLVDSIPGVRVPEPDDPNQSPLTQVGWRVVGPEDWICSLLGRFDFPFEELGPEAAPYSGWIATCDGSDYKSQSPHAWGFAIPSPA